jgi:hypothetical protein
MFKMLIKLGKYLESRQRVIVTPQEYQTLLQRLSTLEARAEKIEQAAVHKDAVKTLVLKVKDIQDEFATIRTGLGLNNPKTVELMAMLNGEPISQENNNG